MYTNHEIYKRIQADTNHLDMSRCLRQQSLGQVRDKVGVMEFGLKPVNLNSQNAICYRWRHFITTHGSDCGYPQAVFSLERGLVIFFA